MLNKNIITKALSSVFAVLMIFMLMAEKNKIMPTSTCHWGLHFEKENTAPVPNLKDEELNPYGAYYHGNLNRKVIYITFDAGYENGNTRPILQALKNHNAPATFFVVGPYIENHPELIKQMVEEGHTVGNHTYNHPDMSKKGKEEFMKQLARTSNRYEKVTGEKMPLFYRPPEGKFSTENLEWANELGYKTILWSSAYVDWNTDEQPSHEYAFRKIGERTFDGAIFLLHSTSATNAEILDEQLTKWENMGYSFGDINNLEKDYEDENT